MDKTNKMSDTNQLDRRQTKTREAILNAFTELLFEQNFQKIKISMVATRANIGRSTLYTHFETKEALLREILKIPMGALASVIGSRDIPAHLDWWVMHFREKQAIARVLLYLPARKEMLFVLSELIAKRLDDLKDKNQTPIIPLKMIAAQIAAAQFEIIEPWILGQIAISSSNISKALHISSNAIANSILQAN